MKSIFRLIAVVSSVIIALVSCGEDQPVQTVLLELDRSNMKMTVGQSQQLNAVLKGSNEECIWKSDDASIAEVEQNGVVTAVSAGKTVIIVKAGEVSASCNLEVVDFKADALDLNDDIKSGLLIVNSGNEYQIQPKFYKAGEKVNELAYPVFAISDPVPSRNGEDVATIDQNGLLKAHAPGKVTVTVSGAGLTKSFTLMVKEFTLDKTSVDLFVRETASVTASVLPSDLPESETIVEWYSSDSEAVAVDAQGGLRALKVTDEPVEVSAVCGNVSLVCLVSVCEFAANSVAFTNLDEQVKKHDGKYEMYVGDASASLAVSFKDAAGADVSDKVTNLSFSSSDPSVATISQSGELAPIASGKTVVKVSGAGVEASFELNVLQGVEELQINPAGTKIVYIGDESFTLSATVFPENASVKTVTFSSDKPEVASVDPKTGAVTIKAGGVARITASTDGFKRPVKQSDGTYSYESISSSLLLTVLDKSSTGGAKVTISADGIVDGTLKLVKGTSVQLTAVTDPADYTGSYQWMVTEDNISVDDKGMLSALSIGSSVVAVVASSSEWGAAIGELPVVVTGINPTAIEITAGPKISTSVADVPVVLEARATAPANADFGGVNWYSSNENVAKVDSNGKLSYVGVGTSVITAKAKSWDGSEELSNVTAQIEVTVANSAIKDFEIVQQDGGIYHAGVWYVEENASMKLAVSTVPMGAQPESVVWESSSIQYATVSSDGVVTGVKTETDKGTEVLITCTVDGSIERNFAVVVVKLQPKDIVATVPDRPLKTGEAWNLAPKVIPESLNLRAMPAFGVPVSDAGVFQTGTPGTYYVGFYVSPTQSESILTTLQRTFTVNVHPYWVESVSLPQTCEMEVGGSATIIPEFTSDVPGMDPYDKTLTWTSQDENIVKVDQNGKLTAVSAGTVEVTVTTSGAWSVPETSAHKSATCTVTVKQPESAVSVGDYFYSDGTISSSLENGKTVIGVVIARDNATSTDKLLPAECTHGLVMVLGESSGNWSSEYSAGYVNDWAVANGYQNTTGTYYDGGAWSYVKNEYAKLLLGYNNTMALKGYIAQNAYSSGIIEALTAYSIQKPASVSDLYIPSISEMELIYSNVGVINASLQAAGGSVLENEAYWTVSENERSQANAATVNPMTGSLQGGKLKSATARVRFIFAF